MEGKRKREREKKERKREYLTEEEDKQWKSNGFTDECDVRKDEKWMDRTSVWEREGINKRTWEAESRWVDVKKEKGHVRKKRWKMSVGERKWTEKRLNEKKRRAIWKDGAEWDERMRNKRAEKMGLNEKRCEIKKNEKSTQERKRAERRREIHGWEEGLKERGSEGERERQERGIRD